MAQLITKFITNNSVKETKILLENDTYLRARNNADSSDVNILRVNTSDEVELINLKDPINSQDAANKNYVDTAIQNMVISDPSAVTGADAIINVMSLTQSEYDAITPDASTLYIITD